MIFFLPSLVVMCLCNSTIQWGCIGFATDSPNFMSTSTKGVPASNWQWISFAYHLLNFFFLWKPLHTWWTLSPRLDITYSCWLRHQLQSSFVCFNDFFYIYCHMPSEYIENYKNPLVNSQTNILTILCEIRQKNFLYKLDRF